MWAAARKEVVVPKGALMFTWGSQVRGREMTAIEVFGETLAYYDGLLKQNRISGIRTYLANTGDLSSLAGVLIIEGELDQLQAILLEPETGRFVMKAEPVVDHFTIQIMTGGSPEDLQETIGAYVDVIGSLGLS